MKNAVEAVKKKEMSIRKAVNIFNIPFTTLRHHIKGDLKCNQPHENKLGNKRTVLTPEEEEELAAFIIDMDNSFYGITINDLRRVTYQYCERKKISHPFNRETEMAGRDFVAGFLRRKRNISLRKPESVSLNRIFGRNKTSVKK